MTSCIWSRVKEPMPFLTRITAFINSDPYYRMSELLEDRNNIEFLITELERLEVEEKK